MRQSTSALRDYLNGDTRRIKAKLVCSAGTIDRIQSIDYNMESGNTITLGSAVSSNIKVSCPTPAFSISGLELTLFFGAVLPGDTDETWTKIGIFKVIPEEIENRMGYTTFTAYDRMYADTKLQYSSTGNARLSDILRDCCGGMQVPAITPDPEINSDIFNEYTRRDVIGFIAGYLGKNAYADCDGNLALRWFTSCDYTADGHKANVPYSDERNISINKVICSTGDENIESGSGTETIVFNCPIMTQERLNEIYASVDSFTYRRLDADIPMGNYLIEPGDMIKISSSGEELSVPVMSMSLHYDGGVGCKVKSFGITDSIVKSVSAKKFADRAKLNKLEQEMVDATNKITGATGGFLRLEYGEDGKTAELLLMDAPNKDDAKGIWRWNIEGLGHTNDGYNGAYTTAITSDGHIVADYITAGVLSGIVIKTIATGIKDKSYVKLLEGGLTYFTSLNAAGEGAEEGREIGKSVLVKQGYNEGIANLVRQGSFWSIGKLLENGYQEEVIYTPSPGPNMDCEVKIAGNLLVERWGKNTEYENVAARIDEFNRRIEALEGMFRLVIREE